MHRPVPNPDHARVAALSHASAARLPSRRTARVSGRRRERSRPITSTTSIPAFHVSDPTKIEGSGEVFISSRTGGAAGVFMVNVAVQFDPAVHDYPIGSLTVRADLSDSLKATFTASSIELVNSYGKHNPTACLTGRCKAEGGAGVPLPRGLRYWLLVADNQSAATGQGTPDVVSFAIHDRTGNRIAYGTGPLRRGAISVAPK